MLTIILIVHLLVALTLIGLILIQRGKGADIGAAFGSGASQTVFGSRGSASFLTRTTAILATVFFITSLSLGYLYSQRVEQKSVTDLMEQPVLEMEMPQAPEAPADVPV
ncbi:MAG TPA: preprotein translocase subunit SecG, partial [Chromatiales bacterium]|nr:preprotein translocase subunit SecG [Chromatiales bacterium]